MQKITGNVMPGKYSLMSGSAINGGI